MSTALKRILVVDDDSKLLREIKIFMEKRGYEVETVDNGLAAIAIVGSKSLDMVVLDITFPDFKTDLRKPIDGIEVLRRIREEGGVPVLMLSSTNISSVKIMALAIGADDYVSKPFDLEELGARVDAILRRTDRDRFDENEIIDLDRLRLDPAERRLWKDGEVVDLTGVEFDLLYTLARRPAHVFTREKLLEHAWKEPSYNAPKVVDVHIGHIRQKIEDDPIHPEFIVTVRGTGYRFEDAPA